LGGITLLNYGRLIIFRGNKIVYEEKVSKRLKCLPQGEGGAGIKVSIP